MVYFQINIASQDTGTGRLHRFSSGVHLTACDYKQQSLDTNGGFIIGRISQTQAQNYMHYWQFFCFNYLQKANNTYVIYWYFSLYFISFFTFLKQQAVKRWEKMEGIGWKNLHGNTGISCFYHFWNLAPDWSQTFSLFSYVYSASLSHPQHKK